jgi:hypothetical protein
MRVMNGAAGLDIHPVYRNLNDAYQYPHGCQSACQERRTAFAPRGSRGTVTYVIRLQVLRVCSQMDELMDEQKEDGQPGAKNKPGR